MTTQNKKDKIKSLVTEMLNQSHEAMVRKIERALNSGAIDIDSWDESNNPMILPKCITIALLEDESTQYNGRGIAFEKEVKKEVRNIKCFL
jgi:hypothetical protein